jgi:competence protein ComEA
MEKGRAEMGRPAVATGHHVVGVLFAALILWFAAIAVGLAQGKDGGAKRIDLNKASVEELDRLPEIGPKLAKAIVEFREKSGPFRRVEELLAVPGISKRRLEKIRPFVFVEEMKKSEG